MMDITTLGNQRIDQKTFEQLLKHIKLKVTEEYSFPPEIITCGGATIATLGNFSASVGKPKSKKTFNVSAIVAPPQVMISGGNEYSSVTFSLMCFNNCSNVFWSIL